MAATTGFQQAEKIPVGQDEMVFLQLFRELN
jgi:tryptophanyl-tRNA synthetase